ncbi:MAG: carboxypeptidase regulatory-like domain-containing protein, partial [Terracidiphilus sp.]
IYGTATALPYTNAPTDPTAYNGQGVGYIAYHVPVPKMLEWNLEVQRAFATNYMAQLAYVGSHGSKLIFLTDLNAVPQQYLSSNDTQYRPYQLYQSIAGSTNNGISNYHSLQASITKRMTKGVSYSFNYVWSHMLDDQDSSGWGSHGGPQNWQIANNTRANYSNSNFDVRHAFKGYIVYALPFGQGQRFLNQGTLVNQVLGGWQISGTVVEMTGQPFTVFGTQNTYQQAGSPFPNWNPGVSWKPLHQSARCTFPSPGACMNEWYNPAAFTMPANGEFGNVRRNALYGPGINQVNLSGGKSFALPWEGMSLMVRADATNAFNHASFGLPTGTLGGAPGPGQPYTYGQNSQGAGAGTTEQISGTTVGGRAMQFLMKLTF